jgi:hypothetical protein
LKDDKVTAMQLFALINIIVQSSISAKAQIEAMYASLPPRAVSTVLRQQELSRDRKKKDSGEQNEGSRLEIPPRLSFTLGLRVRFPR